MLSVIIPVYNTRPYLDKCISSVVSQSYRDLEILLIDDASTDGSSVILDQWAEKDSRIRVFHKQVNSGVSESRNIGLSEAHGEYIAFVDSDDWLDIDMYEAMIACLEASDADILIGGHKRVLSDRTVSVLPKYETGKVVSVNDALLECMPQQGEGRSNLFLVDKLFRAQIVKAKGRPILFHEESSFCEDVLWLIEVMLNCCSVVFWQGAGYNYLRNREGNTWTALSQYKDLQKCKSALTTNRIILELLHKSNRRIENNQLQRVLVYQRYAFRTASKIGDREAYKEYRRGYYKQLFEWYRGNRSFIGFKWLIRQVRSDLLFQVKKNS